MFMYVMCVLVLTILAFLVDWYVDVGPDDSICCLFFNDTATTEIYTRSLVGSVRCV